MAGWDWNEWKRKCEWSYDNKRFLELIKEKPKLMDWDSKKNRKYSESIKDS